MVSAQNTFGIRLKQLREQKEMTQQELGKLFNVSKTAISLYESGKRFPDQSMLNKLAEYFNVSFDFLFGRNDDVISGSNDNALAEGKNRFVPRNLALLRGKRTYSEYSEYLAKNGGKQIPAWMLKEYESGKDLPIPEIIAYIAKIEDVRPDFFYKTPNEILLEYAKTKDEFYFMDENVKSWVKDPQNYKLILLAYNTYSTIKKEPDK